MGPAGTHKVAMVSGVAMQDEEGDGERHRTDGAGRAHTPDMNDLGDLNTALHVFDTSNIDRLEDGSTAPLTAAASSAKSTTSGSFHMLQMSTSCGCWKSSDAAIDQSTKRPTCAGVCQCHLGSVCEPSGWKAATLADDQLQELTELEAGCAGRSQEVCVTELEAGCAGRSQEVCGTELEAGCAGRSQEAGSERVRSHTDGQLVQNTQCEHEHEKIELTVHANVNISSMEGRKRKLDQSSMSLVDVTRSPAVPKQARVEDNCNFNKSSTVDIFPNECEVQHKLSEKLSSKRLIQSAASHRIVNLTVDENTWPLNLHTDGVCVNLRELAVDRQPHAVSGGDHVSVAAAMSASEASTQLRRPGKLDESTEAQPDLWGRMEVLCEPAGNPSSCATRWSIFTTLADTIMKRLFTEKNSPGRQAKIQSLLPGARPGSRVAKHVLAYDDGYHHGNIRTGSHNTRRTCSKARSGNRGIRMKKTTSTSEHMVDGSAGRHRHRFRSNSSSDWSSRSRSPSPADSGRSHSGDSDNCDEYACDGMWSSEDSSHYRCHCHGSTSQPRVSGSRLASSRCYSRTRSRYKPTKSHSPQGLDIIKQLLTPLVLPSSVTTFIVAPVTGVTTAGKGHGGTAAINMPSLGNSIENKHPSTITSSSPEKTKKVNGGQNVFLPNMGDRNKFESKGSNEASMEANANMSLPPRPQNMANSRMEAGNPEHYAGPLVRSANHFGEHSEHSLQREQARYEPHYNNMGYHPDLDHSFSEDAGYEFYGGDYDYLYDERNDDYGFGNEPHPAHLHQRHPGPNTYYPRRPPPQGPRGPPQMFASNERSYGPPRHGIRGPSSRMGPNGPVGSRGPRSPMGPRGHRPQGGPLGPPVMRGPPRGSPYGPPRGSPYGPPGPMRPQGMRGPPGPGMMGQAGHGGPRPRLGPPARMQSPMPRQGSQPPSGLRPRMGPPPPGSAAREDQYLPPRPAILPSSSGEPSFCSPLPNLSQPPPNFVPSLPPSASTPAPPASQVTDLVEPPPPLPPPKPPTPKPPPPPKKEEEKKEEIKPMTPLIPPEQAEQYRKLREQARKHARKQQRRQEHQAKGEPESSDDDDEEKAKRKEYEAKLTAEREEMEKAALLAVQDNGALHYEEGAAILMPATQPALVQQPTVMVQHHPMATQPSSYGLMPTSQLLHTGHPGIHPSQLQNLQFMASAGQPQLVQLPNGQMAYATAAPMAYQAAGPMMAMQHQAMSAPHHFLLSSGGMHQVPVTAHPGMAVSGSPYMAQYVMATQAQAAQIQAAQIQAAQIQMANQVQAAQAAQIQAAQAAQIQAAQVQAAQAAQVQAAQAAQVQAAQAAQVQSGMPGMVSGVHMGQHVLPANYPQGQYILVPRMARPQM